MSFRGLGYDFSTLPKVVTHAQLGRMGECSIWTPWDCIGETDLARADEELGNAQAQIIKMSTALSDALNWANSLPGDAPDRAWIVSEAQRLYNNSRQMVAEHAQLINQLHSGSGTAGLHGRTRGLGIAFAAFIPPILALVDTLVLVYLIKTIGEGAAAFGEKWKSNAQESKTFARYLDVYQSDVNAGRTPPKPPNTGGGVFGDIALGTGTLIVGALAVLWFMALTKS